MKLFEFTRARLPDFSWCMNMKKCTKRTQNVPDGHIMLTQAVGTLLLHGASGAGLPDGLFLNQKSLNGYSLEGPT
jgi:hypothetical protein